MPTKLVSRPKAVKKTMPLVRLPRVVADKKTGDELAREQKIRSELPLTTQKAPDPRGVFSIRQWTLPDDYVDWAGITYKEQFWTGTQNRVDGELDGAMRRADPNMGGIVRYKAISLLNLMFNIESMDTITVVIRMRDNIRHIMAHCGMLFMELIPRKLQNMEGEQKDDKLSRLHMDKVRSQARLDAQRRKRLGLPPQAPKGTRQHWKFLDGVEIRYFSVGPSYTSVDGEYRPNLLTGINKLLLHEQHADIINEVRRYVVRVSPERGWEVTSHAFYPSHNQSAYSDRVRTVVENEDWPNFIFAMAWFMEIYNLFHNMTESHTNENFRKMFHPFFDKDEAFIRELISSYSQVRVDMMYTFLTHVYYGAVGNRKSSTGRHIGRLVRMGHKMIPLKLEEVEYPFRLESHTWREYHVAKRATDLVLNAISPSFPCTGEWFYMKSEKGMLYDNPNQKNKMHKSRVAREVAHGIAQNKMLLERARIEETGDTLQSFKKACELLDDSIKSLKRREILSEVSLGIISEHVGGTVMQHLRRIGTEHRSLKHMGHPFTAKGSRFFDAHMFHVMYGLLAANRRLHVLHGDLHLHNVTFGNPYHTAEPFNGTAEGWCCFNLDETTTFVVPHRGYFSYIIDFSRSIMQPEHYKDMRPASLPRSYQIVSDPDEFLRYESARLAGLYVRKFSGRAAQLEDIKVKFHKHIEAAFRLMTCIDPYFFSMFMIKAMDGFGMKGGSAQMRLMKLIHEKAGEYIVKRMGEFLLNPDDVAPQILENEWPISTIIRSCFSDYVNPRHIVGEIRDVYSMDNPMQYSNDRFKDLPPYFHTVPDSLPKDHVMRAVSNRANAMAARYAHGRDHNLKMVDYISGRHQEKRFA